MPRILLLGAGGQLGMVLAREIPNWLAQEKLGSLGGDAELIALTRAQVDFSDSDAVREAVRQAKPDVVINAAAYTAVDRAEQEQTLAAQVNAVAPGVIGEELARTGGWLVHYSTDYVFDGSGTTPWRETDATGPLSVYGQSKLDGELAIAASGCQHVILRTSWVYAAEGKNFLHTMLRLGRERELLKIVADQIGAPTTAEALADGTLAVLKGIAAGRGGGVYHLTCAGETSWYGFAGGIFEAFKERQKKPELVPIPTEAFPTPAQRPRNSRLSCERFAAEFGYRMPDWETALGVVASEVLSRTAD